MKKLVIFLSFLLVNQFVVCQVVINELDCDSAIDENLEFIELRSEIPNYALDGLVLVFFNGSDSGANSSYLTIDLDGYITDVNGLLLIGSDAVSPFPQVLISGNTIQNGPDAVAIYQASWFDFPDETLATIDNLIDVLMYDTNDTDDTDMLNIFRQDPRFAILQQISEGGTNNANSIQRNNDGSYTVKTPTPRQLNDGTGIVLNGIGITVTQTQYNEGESFDITFTTEQNVSSDLLLNFEMDNDTFNSSDYTGTTAVTILNGLNTVSTTINLIDDANDEGDEVLKVALYGLVTPYMALNNNVAVRVVDNDFVIASYGTPLVPTFGTVNTTEANGYYNSLYGLSGLNLRQALQEIIANPAKVRAQTYADVIDILKEADQNPANSNQVWLVYLEEGRPKLDFQTTSNNLGKWNREHTFPRSLGGFNDIEEDEIADGKDVFWLPKQILLAMQILTRMRYAQQTDQKIVREVTSIMEII